jgi:hypothetical protein
VRVPLIFLDFALLKGEFILCDVQFYFKGSMRLVACFDVRVLFEQARNAGGKIEKFVLRVARLQGIEG